MTSKQLVVIDPGHGGNDPGATHRNTKEKDLVLDIALELRDELIRHGVEVVMTRDDDRDVSLNYRSNLANQMVADCVVSIHCNGFYDEDVSGFEICHYEGSAEGMYLADCIMEHMRQWNRYTNFRPHKTYNLHMTRETDAPCVITEHGFISNEDDLQVLKDPVGNAMFLAKGILDFLGIEWVDPKPLWDIPYYRVQVGAFSMRANANKMKDELKEKHDIDSVVVYK